MCRRRPGSVTSMEWTDHVSAGNGIRARPDDPWRGTIVGGTPELVAALCVDPALEALPLRAGAALIWSSDEVNR
jgi:hypothetical protein